MLAPITHLVGFFPNTREGESALTVDRIASLFSTMPALTHLAFDVLDVSSAEDDDIGDEGYPPDLGAVEIAIRAALSHPRARMVALRVCGDWLSSCPAVRAVAVKLRDPRVFLWEDARPIRVWEDVWTCAMSDAWINDGKSWWMPLGRTPPLCPAFTLNGKVVPYEDKKVYVGILPKATSRNHLVDHTSAKGDRAYVSRAPIRYRRVDLAIRMLGYALQQPEDSLVHCALRDSLNLALAY
ncbi:hypothetical protein AURDEDRAFT_169377 [Auricularia subglabra TFB-10046 SS5]|nr:hypothetical protein AURDEDRAFT_169377 [Auricularia subglabra TFB-10046 SS5]